MNKVGKSWYCTHTHTHTHTGNFIKGKQAIRVALLNIDIKQNKHIVSL